MKVVPDTNVVVSAIIAPNSNPDRALRRMLKGEALFASGVMVAEWREVLARPEVLRYVPRTSNLSLLDDLIARLTIVTPTIAVHDCRDVKDDKVLECALAAGADLIVSGDKDLLVLHPWRGIPILSPMDYLSS